MPKTGVAISFDLVVYKSNAKISHIKPKQTETHKTNKINDIGSVYILQIVCFRLIPFGFFVVFLLHGKIYKHTTQNEEENINYFTPTRVAERSHTAIS